MAEKYASAQEVVSLLPGQLLDFGDVIVKELKAAVRLDKLIIVDASVRGSLNFESSHDVLCRLLLHFLLRLFFFGHFVVF